jgi:hypothetical protein
MAEYIKREATIKAIVDSRNRYYNSASNQYLVGRCDGLDIAAGLLRVAPTADVAPIEALERLRDELCEQDLITMEGLRKLNTLIWKYTTVHDGGADHEAG